MSDSTLWFVASKIEKKKPHITQLFSLQGSISGEDPSPISFFFFGRVPIQVSQRPENQKELIKKESHSLSTLFSNTIIIPDAGLK